MAEARLGRPRSTAVHQAILAAARDLLIENGYAALSMDRVAARAGVGKQSVYRRWPAKAQLVAEAVLDNARASSTTALPADTGDLGRDLRAWLRGHAAFLAGRHNAALVRALAAAAADDPRDADAIYAQLTGPSRQQLIARLRAGVDAGQVRPDADLDAAADALIGAVLYRLLARDTAPHRDTGLVEIILSGLGVAG